MSVPQSSENFETLFSIYYIFKISKQYILISFISLKVLTLLKTTT